MKAIFKREFCAYFHTFIGSLFIAAVLFIAGIYVTVYNLLSALPNIAYALSGILFLFIISVPILTMRVLAEERKQKTDQMLLTAPVSVGKIVVGKFLALGAIYTIPVLVISIYPLALCRFGAIPFAESYVAIAAFYLYGLACITIGIFVSSLTESQVIAAVITFAFLFLSYVMSGICNMISTTGNLLTRILSIFDPVSRFDFLVSGTFDLKCVLYYLTFIVIFLFFTTQSIQKRRYSVSAKKMKMGAYSLSLTAVAAAAAIFLNLMAGELPAKYTIFDVTSNKLYSLTDETKELLKNLEETIHIYVLVNEASQDSMLQKTLVQYGAYSDKIEVSYVDPMVNPKFYTQYTDASITRNSLIVESSKRSKVVDYSGIYETNIDYTTYSQNVTGYDGEGQITSAIAYVTSGNMPKMYFIEGHGELTLDSDFYDMIEKANIEYETINLLQYDAIPEDAECIVINAPASDFSGDDKEKVLDYLKKGGNALLITTWSTEDMSNFYEILNYYEVEVTDGLVLEGDMNAYYQSPFYILPEVAYDTVTESVNGSFIFAPYAQGMILPEETGDDLDLAPLLSSSGESYAKARITDAMDYEKEDDDKEGPFVLGVRAVKGQGEEQSVALIYSSENLFTDAADVMVSGANGKLFATGLKALAETTVSVAIPVKGYEMSYLTVNQSNVVLLGALITLIIPLIILIGGFLLWLKRRKA